MPPGALWVHTSLCFGAGKGLALRGSQISPFLGFVQSGIASMRAWTDFIVGVPYPVSAPGRGQ